jgi:hypothetical protein
MQNSKNGLKTGEIIPYESVTCKYPPGKRPSGKFISLGKKIVHKWLFAALKRGMFRDITCLQHGSFHSQPGLQPMPA